MKDSCYKQTADTQMTMEIFRIMKGLRYNSKSSTSGKRVCTAISMHHGRKSTYWSREHLHYSTPWSACNLACRNAMNFVIADGYRNRSSAGRCAMSLRCYKLAILSTLGVLR